MTDCRSCGGYGHIGDDGRGTIDRRARPCLDCTRTGRNARSYAARVKRGRPTISLSLSSIAVAALDELAAHHGWTRSEVVAVLGLTELDRERERAHRARGATCTCAGTPRTLADAGKEHAAACALAAPLRAGEGLGT